MRTEVLATSVRRLNDENARQIVLFPARKSNAVTRTHFSSQHGRPLSMLRCPVDGEALAAGVALKPRGSLGSSNSLSSGLLRAVL